MLCAKVCGFAISFHTTPSRFVCRATSITEKRNVTAFFEGAECGPDGQQRARRRSKSQYSLKPYR
jgi:hypothetical protein